jgi:hypothetical protein
VSQAGRGRRHCEADARRTRALAAGVMEGKFLDDPSVRRIENLPSKKELMATIAYMIKKARGPARLGGPRGRGLFR